MQTLSSLFDALPFVITVVFGIGFVIFFHELGHFLLAKWHGVKVEKFSIGFGPSLVQWTRGETVYAIAVFPLGGFVKMLGENPEEAAETATDPRAYHNKSVGARMSIISAGVLMNLLLGFVCFVFAYGWGGLLETPAIFGQVVAGQPAYDAGIRVGDQVVTLDGRREVRFMDLWRAVALSAKGQVVHLVLKRPDQTELVNVDILPRLADSADKPSIGVNPCYDLKLVEDPFLAPPGMREAPKAKNGGFAPEDRIVKAGPVGEPPQPLADIFALNRLLARYRDQPLQFVVEHDGKRKSATGGQSNEPSITLPPTHVVDFGFRLTAEPISAIQGDSIAKKAGFQVGDRIVKVDDQADFDPMRLPDYCYDHAGKEVTFEVERKGEGQEPTRATITATPDTTPIWTEPYLSEEPLEVPGLGLAFPIAPRVAAVTADSPAARAGLKPGDKIRAVEVATHDAKGKSKPVTLEFDKGEDAWPHVFTMIQDPAAVGFDAPFDRAVKFFVNDSTKPIAIEPEPAADWYTSLRGLRLPYLREPLPAQGFSTALQMGGQETLENMTSIFSMLRSLVQSRISKRNLTGPIGIAMIAYEMARSGLASFIYFLGLLNVNLAVINFLPIPPLDGGQMVFLAAEKVWGRSLPEWVLSVVTMVGVVFVLGVMVFFVYQDVVFRIFS